MNRLNSAIATDSVQHCCPAHNNASGPVENSLAGFVQHLFDTSSYPARWNCGEWTPLEGWIHIISDVGIFLAYFAIPLALVYFVRRRKDMPFYGIFFLFAAFILCCGTGHLLEAVIFYQPIYRIAGLVKLTTAIVSWVTVFALLKLVPKALELPSIITKNEVLRRADAAKSEFLANMSHEIRTPLTAILGYADLLQGEECTDPTDRENAIVAIKKSGRHLLAIVNDILDLSKIEAGKMAVERIPTPLDPMLCDVINLLRIQAVGKGISLDAKLVHPIPKLAFVDPTRLRQILLNLLSNAIKFTETGGVTLTIDYMPRDGKGWLVMDIADTGSGMSREQSQVLFCSFSQGDGAVTRKFGGSGLGLVISRRLANLMGGNVELLHSMPGKGSCFRVELPIETPPGGDMLQALGQTQVAAPKVTACSTRLSGRILFAEDGPDNQRLISFHLRKAGAAVEIAGNGRIALDLLHQAESKGEPFDLLLTDMQMPEMDGYSLTRAIRCEGSKIPIVALTANAMDEDRERCLEAGCDDYTSKPIDKAALIDICHRHLPQLDAQEPEPISLAADSDVVVSTS